MLLLALGGFVLDAVQLRRSVNPDAQLPFDATAVVGVGKIAFVATVAAVFGRFGWVHSRRLRADAAGTRT